MAIDRLAHSTTDDLDVPDFLKPGYSDHETLGIIPGEIIPAVQNDADDDIAPGTIEYRPARPPVLARSGSAAMVAASRTGRVVGLSARAAAVAGRWFGHGAKSTAVLSYRYVRAHDHQEALGGMASGSDWNRVHETRRKRWRVLGWTAAGLGGADLVAWAALVAAGMPASDAWAVAPGLETAAATAAVTLYGRYRLGAQLAPGQAIDPEDVDDGHEPYPLAWCTSGDQVEECVSRALAAEGISTRRIQILGHRPWGWEIDITLKGSKPGKVNAVAEELDTHFDIPHGGTLIEPDPASSAHIVLRLVQSDPFADMPRPTVHAPNSLSVRDLVVYGRGMDGSPLEFRLRGMSMLVIGSSGSAKTKGALRCLAEAITACRDAIAVEMDPVKDGLREFEPLMAAPSIRGKEACTEWLGYLTQIASARNRVKHDRNMGDLWEPSPEHPTIFAIVDEFIYLPQEAKDKAIELLRIGRETGVHIIFAAQEATEDSLGDAVADAVTYRIMLASRSTDIRLVFGTGAAADGYRPDRLRPAVDDERVYDAGKFYIKGPGFLRPIQWRWNRFEREQIRQAVDERKVAGRPGFDHDSLVAADLLHVITGTSASGKAQVSVADRLDALAAQGGIEDARLVAVLLREFELSGEAFLPTSEVLLPALVNAGFGEIDGGRLGRILKAHAPGAVSERQEWDGRPQVRGWQRATVERAAAGLIDPSRARLEAA